MQLGTWCVFVGMFKNKKLTLAEGENRFASVTIVSNRIEIGMAHWRNILCTCTNGRRSLKARQQYQLSEGNKTK